MVVIIRLDRIIQFFFQKLLILDSPIESGNDRKDRKQLLRYLKINNINL